ncbi:c-type cytochrome [Hydrogenimonas urashimensis]|uniref:c-type cytochrome n=1 Tax=Hydrogenimonas urashimensis TaxID=2740515 RepID=UPI0019154227|nr:cytochrome c [Hydrogenimonas urashimensis]
MIRHIIAAIATLLAIWAMVFMYQLDRESERFKQIRDIIEKTKMEVPQAKTSTPPIQQIEEPVSVEEQMKKEEDEVAKKLKSLRERAGSAMAFKVSPMYKQKCSSCHGVNGEGAVGPKLIGRDQAYVYQALMDFKSGKRKNYVMYGLLMKMSDEDLKALSKEIGTFEEKMKAAAE